MKAGLRVQAKDSSMGNIPYRQSLSLSARLGGDGGRVWVKSGFLSFDLLSRFPALLKAFSTILRLNSLPSDLRP